jgi:hypothetical protein
MMPRKCTSNVRNEWFVVQAAESFAGGAKSQIVHSFLLYGVAQNQVYTLYNF